MSNLEEIAGTDDPDRAGDVVFVHGLNGNARQYWAREGRPDTFWPEWVGRDFPDLGVWSLGYEAAAFEWKGGTMPLYVRANNALDLLTLSEVGRRPLVFITHSMGGLLVKQMLQNAKGLRKPSWVQLAEKTRGVVYISTPHSGSNLANWISFLGWLLRSSVSVEDLKANAPRLRELNTWYRENVGFDGAGELPVRAIVYYEERKTRWRAFKLLGATVVDRASADPGLKGVVPIGLDADHQLIHRPESPKAQLYLGVRQFLRECFSPDPR